MLPALLIGCHLTRMLPGGPVLTGDELPPFEQGRAATVTYGGPARVDMPVLPLQVFGYFYDVDIVLVSRHPDWDMHEYARIQTPDGPTWLAKDADNEGVQAVVVDVASLPAGTSVESVVAEMPVPRIPAHVTVTDNSVGDVVDVVIDTVNPAGEAVHMRFKGKMPAKAPRLRNGSTMGHSRQAAAVVLDLQRFGKGGKVHLEIDGQRVPMKRVFGVVPMVFLLQQDQGGIVASSHRQFMVDDQMVVQRPASAGELDPATGEPGWPTARTEPWTVESGLATQDNPWTRFEYRFVEGGLHRATVFQHGRELPVFDLWLDPALPDLSRPFEGTATSHFRMDLNGQLGHGTGTVTATWDGDDSVSLELRPSAPWWLADRPMDGSVHFEDDGSVVVQVARVP